jgi:Spy/CpxP family protein refolding chaperone
MKFKTKLCVIFAVFMASAVFAAPRGNMPFMPGQPPPVQPRGMQPSILAFAVELDLTAAQIEKLVAIEKESNAKAKKIHQEMKALMEQMRKETEKDSPDESKVDEIINRIAENHKLFMKERFHDMLQIKAVLTKDQREKMKKLMESEMRRPEPGKDFIERP